MHPCQAAGKKCVHWHSFEQHNAVYAELLEKGPVVQTQQAKRAAAGQTACGLCWGAPSEAAEHPQVGWVTGGPWPEGVGGGLVGGP